MKPQNSLLLLLFLMLALTSCSDNEINEEYKKSQVAFDASNDAFYKANDSTHVDITKEQYIAELERGIAESEKVSDDYLDFIHPQLKSMYRDNYIGSYKYLLECIINTGCDKDQLKIQLGKNMEYYAFYQANRSSITDKMEQIEEWEPVKKSYWRMLLRLFISNVVAILLFSITFSFLLLSIDFLITLVNKLRKRIMSRMISLLLGIIYNLGKAYSCIVWTAYCAFTTQFYVNAPTVSHSWLYYITGFFSVLGPYRVLVSVESAAEKEASSLNEHPLIQLGTTFFLVTTWWIVFIVFCIWPSLLTYPAISWLNDWLYSN